VIDQRELEPLQRQPQFVFISPLSEQVDSFFEVINGQLSQETRDALGSREIEFRQLLAVNNLFSSGHDSFAGAKVELLRRMKEQDPGSESDLSKEWGIPEDVIVQYAHERELIEGIITTERSREEISTDTVRVLGRNSLPLEAYTISKIAEGASGTKPDLVVLQRLARVLKVYTIGKTDIWSGNDYSLHSTLYAMEACLKDLAFYLEMPHVYVFSNNVATRTTGIDPTERYNVQYLTDLARHILVTNDMLDRESGSERVQVIGSVAPVKSVMTELLEDEVVKRKLVELLSTDDLRNLEAILLSGVSPDHTVEAVIKRGFTKYDKLRCRILVADTEMFDQVVSRVERARKRRLFGRKILEMLRIKPLDSPQITDQLQGYMRLTLYADRAPERRKEPISSDPHRRVLDHMANIPEGALGYAAVHVRMPVVVDTNRGKSLPLFETQVRLGGKSLDVMYAAAEAVYDVDGDFSKAGLSPRLIKSVHDGSHEEVEQFILQQAA